MKTEDIKDVSYITFESVISRLDRVIKRLWIIILILIFLLLGTNLAWLYYESQFEEVEQVTTTQDVKQKGDKNTFIGGDNGYAENQDDNDTKKD